MEYEKKKKKAKGVILLAPDFSTGLGRGWAKAPVFCQRRRVKRGKWCYAGGISQILEGGGCLLSGKAPAGEVRLNQLGSASAERLRSRAAVLPIQEYLRYFAEATWQGNAWELLKAGRNAKPCKNKANGVGILFFLKKRGRGGREKMGIRPKNKK